MARRQRRADRRAPAACRRACRSTRCTLDARGAVENLQLRRARRAAKSARWRCRGRRAQAGRDAGRARWRRCSSTRPGRGVAPAAAGALPLETAATARWHARCLASSGGGSLCASADWPRRGLDVQGEGLPLALLVPYLPPNARTAGRGCCSGEVALDAQLRPAGNAWRGQRDGHARPAAACATATRAPPRPAELPQPALDRDVRPATHQRRRSARLSTTTAASTRASPPAGTPTRRCAARSRSTPTN